MNWQSYLGSAAVVVVAVAAVAATRSLRPVQCPTAVVHRNCQPSPDDREVQERCASMILVCHSWRVPDWLEEEHHMIHSLHWCLMEDR